MSSPYVLDASALLCLLNAEKGSEKVANVLPQSVTSSVNLSEVAAKLSDLGMDSDAITNALIPLHLKIVAFDDANAIAAGTMRAVTRSAGLSFGDRACLALACSLGAPALTADRAWKPVAKLLNIRIEFVR